MIDQPLPTPNDQPCIQDLVIADIEARKAIGRQRYGTVLQPFNGRDALRDAYEEALDLCQYLKQELIERAGREDRAAADASAPPPRPSPAGDPSNSTASAAGIAAVPPATISELGAPGVDAPPSSGTATDGISSKTLHSSAQPCGCDADAGWISDGCRRAGRCVSL